MAPNKRQKTTAPRDITHRGSGSRQPEPQAAPQIGFQLHKVEHLVRYTELQNRVIRPPRFIDWGWMETLGLKRGLKRCLRNAGLQHFFRLKESAYRTLVLEFLSTLEAHIMEGAHRTEGRCTFQLGGEERTMTLSQINTLFGFRDEPEDVPRWESQATWVNHRSWQQLTGKAEYLPRRAKSTAIIHPVVKIIQRYFAHSITARGNGENNAPRKDLHLLCAILEGHEVNFGGVMMNNLAHISRGTKGPITCGHLITVFAKHFGVGPHRFTDEVKPLPMDFSFFNRMSVLFEWRSHFYWRLGDTAKAMRLPDEERCDLHCGMIHRNTWLIKPSEEDPTVDLICGGSSRKQRTAKSRTGQTEPEEEEEEATAAEEEEEDEDYEMPGREAAENEGADFSAPPQEQEAPHHPSGQYAELIQMMGGLSTQLTEITRRLDYQELQIGQLHRRLDSWTPQGYPSYTYYPYPGEPSHHPPPSEDPEQDS